MNKPSRYAIVLAVVAMPACWSGCLSSAPPAPPVRWFDPLPASTATSSAAVAPADAPAVTVIGAPNLREEFAVRVGEHEIVFDEDHRWLQSPVMLVSRALQAAGLRTTGDNRMAQVVVEAFELQRTGAPVAHVGLRVQATRDGPGAQIVSATVAAEDASPEALVRAMSEALLKAASNVAAKLTAVR